jgi:hypothetical protein
VAGARRALTTLPNHTAIGTLSDAGIPLSPFALRTDPPTPSAGEGRAEAARDLSRTRWGRPVDGLDEAFFGRWRHVPGSISAKAQAARELKDRGDGLGTTDPSFLDSWLAKRDPANAVSEEDS